MSTSGLCVQAHIFPTREIKHTESKDRTLVHLPLETTGGRDSILKCPGKMGNCIPSKQSEDMLQGVVETKVFLVTVWGREHSCPEESRAGREVVD